MLSHGKYIMGLEVNELEQKLASFTGAKHVITCGNGTDALLMVLMALGIKAGDAVFTTPFSFVATSELISLVGVTPVFVDIDPKTFNTAGYLKDRLPPNIVKQLDLNFKLFMPKKY